MNMNRVADNEAPDVAPFAENRGKQIRHYGLFEAHLGVADLERSAAFYEETLNLPLAHMDERGARFYWIGGPGVTMLGLWKTDPDRIVRNHLAFRMTPEELPDVMDTLRKRGVKLRNFRGDGEEPLVFGWMPAVSIYFEDPDGHSLEYIAMLPGKPAPELGVVTMEEWSRRLYGKEHSHFRGNE